MAPAELSNTVQIYFKNLIVQYMSTNNKEIQEKIELAIYTLLKLSPDEIGTIKVSLVYSIY